MNLILNPTLVKSILIDAGKQIAYHAPKLTGNLSKINPYTVKSWGDLSSKMTKIVGHNKKLVKDVISHVGTRYKMSLDPNFRGVLKGKEFVSRNTGLIEAKKGLLQKGITKTAGVKTASVKTAGITGAIKTGIGTGLSLGLIGGAAALGAGAIGYQYFKHDKFLKKSDKEINNQYDHFIKLIRAKREKEKIENKGYIKIIPNEVESIEKGEVYFNDMIQINKNKNQLGQQSKISISTDLTLDNLLKHEKVTRDKGVNGMTMARWLQGNASLIPQLAQKGYNIDDLINEAYSQTRYDRSAFSDDMIQTNRNKNQPYIETKASNTGGMQKDEEQIADEGLTDEQKAAIKIGHSDIDAMLSSGKITEAQAAILHEIYAGDYTSGQKIPNNKELNQIIADATANATKELSPYYEKMEYRDLEDMKQDLADIRKDATIAAQKEQRGYKQQLERTRQSLRQRGLTFSGAGRKLLGAESALEGKGIEKDVEGLLPEERRMGYETRTADLQRQTRDKKRTAERKWGTGFLSPDAYGSVWTPYGQQSLQPTYKSEQYTDDMEKQRQAAIDRLEWEKISKYRRY